MRSRALVTTMLTLAVGSPAAWAPRQAQASVIGEAQDANKGANTYNPWGLPVKARVMSARNEQIYPPEAVTQGIEGRVLAAFDITTDGNAANVWILWAENPLLAEATKRALAAYHFDVPADWGNFGARRRWRMGFVYCLAPSAQPTEFAVPVEVTSIAVPRASATPVRNPPATASACKH